MDSISRAMARSALVLSTLLMLADCGGGGSSSGGAGTATPVGGLPPGSLPITNKVSGVVTDKSGRPVAGVTISVFHHNENSTVTAITDANGAYAVSGQSTGVNSDYAIYAAKAGYGFYPAVGDAAGAVGRLDFNGLYRTVIRFLSMPPHDVSSANFTAFAAGDKVASVARTGQRLSYGAGDDVAAQSGVAWPSTRFSDNGDGTVSDHLTGLIWLKDAGCVAPGNWSDALARANALASGSCGLSDASVAGNWRMPNANELESLVDISSSNPALTAGAPFLHVDVQHAYWSSTTYMALQSNAMAIRFSDGRWINGIDGFDGGFNNLKATSSNGLWAVKSGGAGAVQLFATGVYDSQGGLSFGVHDDASLQLGAPLPSPRFIDQGDGTVADTATGLVWLKQADCFKQDWSTALASINSLASGSCGLRDGSHAGQWRLPNRNEMLSLSDRAPTFPQASYLNGQYQTNNSIDGPVIFSNYIVSDYYWTSSTDAADISQAWTVYSCDFGVYNIDKAALHYALAVR